MNLKKIIREEINDFDWTQSNEINHLNWKENAENFGGAKNMTKDLYNNDPMNFLLSLPKMDVVQSKDNPNWTLFRYKPKENLMIYNRKNNVAYINYQKIWSFFQFGFELTNPETQQLIKAWLYEVYNLRGVTPYHEIFGSEKCLYEVYNLRGVTPSIRIY